MEWMNVADRQQAKQAEHQAVPLRGKPRNQPIKSTNQRNWLICGCFRGVDCLFFSSMELSSFFLSLLRQLRPAKEEMKEDKFLFSFSGLWPGPGPAAAQAFHSQTHSHSFVHCSLLALLLSWREEEVIEFDLLIVSERKSWISWFVVFAGLKTYNLFFRSAACWRRKQQTKHKSTINSSRKERKLSFLFWIGVVCCAKRNKKVL